MPTVSMSVNGKSVKADVDSAANTVPLVDVVTARVMAILTQLAIVIGMVLVGVRHFDSIKTGIAAATLYLLLPYTAMWTGSVTHALPGALLDCWCPGRGWTVPGWR